MNPIRPGLAACFLCLLFMLASPIATLAQMLPPPVILYATLEVDTTSPYTDWTDGKCSLREAILNINAHNQGGSFAGECEEANGSIGHNVTFSPAVFGSGASITLTSSSTALPTIEADWVTIDGWSAGGRDYTGPPLVTLDGAGWWDGLRIFAANNTVRGLALVNFNHKDNASWAGVYVNGPNNRIYGNHIGIRADGRTVAGNDQGIYIAEAGVGTLVGTNGDRNNDEAERNVISGNEVYGLNAQAGTIAGNYIGTDASGLVAKANGTGLGIAGNVTLGGDGAVFRNIISGSTNNGIVIWDAESLAVQVRGNYIGTDRTGLKPLANLTGISLTTFAVEGTGSGQVTIRDNVVSGNKIAGIKIASCAAETCPNLTGGHQVLDNLVGLGPDGTTFVGNSEGIVLQNSPGNLVGGNTISGNDDTGLVLRNGLSTGNRIENNVVGLTTSGKVVLPQPQLSGMTLWAGASENVISGNTIAANLNNQVNIYSTETSSTIDNTLSNNRICSDQDGGYVAWHDVGVTINDATGTSLKNNEFRYCRQAILLRGDSETRLHRNLLTLNDDSVGVGVELQDFAALLPGSTENCLESNYRGVDNQATYSVTFESNWWGDASGPSGVGSGTGDSVSTKVDYEPWLAQRPSCGLVALGDDIFNSGFENP